jgi:hypothetical protein
LTREDGKMRGSADKKSDAALAARLGGGAAKKAARGGFGEGMLLAERQSIAIATRSRSGGEGAAPEIPGGESESRL